MRQGLVVSGVVVVLALGCAALFGRAAMGAYLAAWLVFLAVPAGALPLVLGSELAGLGGAAQNGFLRWLLVLMPAAGLLGLPVLLSTHALYPWAGQPQHGLAAAWFTPVWFAVRGVAYLACWTWLCLAALRPPAGLARVGLCAGGLALHAVLVTLAATDWVASLSPGLDAAGFGLLFGSLQAGVALCVGLLLARVRPADAAALLLVATVVWAMLHAVQYLVVWSADEPGEVVWYLQRGGALGVAAVWLGVAGLVACLVSQGVGGVRGVLAGTCGLVLAGHVVEMFWLVTPSLRQRFSVSPADLVALVALALAAWACVRVWRPAQVVA